MKTISPALAAHLAGQTTTLGTCLLITWNDATDSNGPTQLGFTDHDRDLEIDGITYYSVGGYNASDVATSSDMNVDNLEVLGVTETTITHPAITEEDLLAGRWDYAAYRLFMVNWQDLTQGELKLRTGRIGEVTLERERFRAELLGLMQRYATRIGRMEGPGCDANLGDDRCTVDLGPFTVTGTIDSANADGVTLYDAARTEDGPSGGFAITNITNADPAVVTTSTAHGFTEGQAVTIAGVVGMTPINAVTVVLNPSGNTFELSVDTSDTADYPPYVSGGTVTPFSDSGYFDGGVIKMTSGPNDGLRMEVKSYTTGQITLALPFPELVQAGDSYSMTPGCDKSLETCRDRFNNVVNFRGFPYLPGIDKLVQVGRRN